MLYYVKVILVHYLLLMSSLEVDLLLALHDRQPLHTAADLLSTL